MASKKNIVIVGNIVYVPVGLDVGNSQVKAIVGGSELTMPSYLEFNPKGEWSSDRTQRTRYLQADGITPFIFGDVAEGRSGAHCVGDSPQEHKVSLAPYFALAALSVLTPDLLPKGSEQMVVRPYIQLSTQDADWAEATVAAFASLRAKSFTIEKFGKTFVIDWEFVQKHLTVLVEGHRVCSLISRRSKLEGDVLFLDFGGRTIHATTSTSAGFTKNDTVTVDGGTLYLFERLLTDPKLGKILGKDLKPEDLTPQELAQMVQVSSDKKLLDLATKHLRDWLNRPENSQLWKKVSASCRRGSAIICGGGGIGIQGFRDAFEKTLKKRSIQAPGALLLASEEFPCEAHLANAWSLHRSAINELKQLLS